MGDLSEELRKAGLISDKQYKQTQHQERVKHKDVGHKGLEKEKKQRSDEIEHRRDRKREADRERVRQEKQVVEEKMTRAQLKDIVKNSAVKSGASGSKRFYFLARDGKIPFLEVNDEAARALQYGDLAIVRIPDMKLERFVLLPRRTAEKVKALEPDLVVLLNGGNDR